MTRLAERLWHYAINRRPYEIQTDHSSPEELVKSLGELFDKSAYVPFGKVTLDGKLNDEGMEALRYGMGQRRVILKARFKTVEEGVKIVGYFEHHGAPIAILYFMFLVLFIGVSGSISSIIEDGFGRESLTSAGGGLMFATTGLLMSRWFFGFLNIPDVRNIKLGLEEALDGHIT